MLQSSLHCLQIACLAHQSFFKRTTDDSGFQGHNVELTLTCVFINFKVISSQPAMSAVISIRSLSHLYVYMTY